MFRCSTRGVALSALFFLTSSLLAQAPESEVSLKAIKYADLGALVNQHKGKVVVVDFWQDTCIPCKKKFPHLVEMAKKYADDGLVVVSVSLDNPTLKDKNLAFLQKQKATFTNLILDEPIALWQEKLQAVTLPLVFVFNREGRYQKFNAETFDAENPDKQVEDLVVALLKKK
jgi:thiol-disulfide isomerase/thioredoxin